MIVTSIELRIFGVGLLGIEIYKLKSSGKGVVENNFKCITADAIWWSTTPTNRDKHTGYSSKIIVMSSKQNLSEQLIGTFHLQCRK